MQVIKAYYDEGKFVPFEPVRIPKGSHVIVTILDFPMEEVSPAGEESAASDEPRSEWHKRLKEAIRLSRDEDLPDFPRIKTVREPLDFGG